MKKHFAYPQETEATVGDGFVCGGCGLTQSGPVSAGYDVPELGQHLCTDCFNAYHSEINDEAEAYAQSHCVITSRLGRIGSGRPESIDHTEDGSWPRRTLTFLLERRSDCTNYDELVRPFADKRGSVAAGIHSSAIQRRIDSLLTEEARMRGIAVPIESGRMPRTVFVSDSRATKTARLCG